MNTVIQIEFVCVLKSETTLYFETITPSSDTLSFLDKISSEKYIVYDFLIYLPRVRRGQNFRMLMDISKLIHSILKRYELNQHQFCMK